MTLSAYAAPRCGSREALASMYADLGGQKHSDPGTFRSRLAWWTGTIAAACWDRVLPHALCWPVDADTPTQWADADIGRPLCLSVVIREQERHGRYVRLSAYLDRTWTAWWARQWRWRSAHDDDDDEALWSHVHGEWVVCENVERAARLATARDWSALERIMSRADAKAYLASLHDGSRPLALSDKDTDILLTHLVHDARAIQHDGDVYKWGTARVTEQDRGILAVKGLHAQLERQVDAWQARMERAQATVRRALQAKEREAVTLSYLRTQKQLESMVDKRVLALEKVHTLLLSMDQAVGDAQLMQAYTASEKTLRSLLDDPSLQPDHIDRTMDALAEAVHDQNAVTDALSSAPDDELADELAQLELDTLPSPPATQPEATSPETTSLSMKTTHDTQKQAVPA